MKRIADNINHIKRRIKEIAHTYQRDPDEITLLAVTKNKTDKHIQEAILAGQYWFGENYVQEGCKKILHFRSSCHKMPLVWHFIGALQSNKTRVVAENFDWVHSVNSVKIAERLNQQRPKNNERLNALIQINISNEDTKSGITPRELDALATTINALPNIRLRGIMAIPAPNVTEKHRKQEYANLFALYSQLRQQYPHVDTFSLGMSEDMEAAIAAGSTLVRIGTAIFGARNQ